MEAKSSFSIGRYLSVRAISIFVAVGGCLLLNLLSQRLPGGDYSQRLVWLAGLYVTLAVSLNLINGITGQFSIGHAAFYMVGAYLGAFLTNSTLKGAFPDTDGQFSVVLARTVEVVVFVVLATRPFIQQIPNRWIRFAIYVGMMFVAQLAFLIAKPIFLHFPFPFKLLQAIQKHDILWLIVMGFAGAIGAAVAGLLVGLPSLRLRGDYLAIVTLGFGEIIRILVQNTKEIGGSYGMNIDHKIPAIGMIWILAIICIAVSRNLLKTARGLLFLSVREDEIAASAMGVNVTKIKVSAFLLGSAFAGAAGALYAHSEGFITPATFGMDVSFIILTMVVLGGTGSITGSLIAAVILSMLPEALRMNKQGPEAIVMVCSWLVAIVLSVLVVARLIKAVTSFPAWSIPIRVTASITTCISGVLLAFALTALLKRVFSFGIAPFAASISKGAGQAITVMGSSVVATLLALVAVVVVIKRIMDAGKGTKLVRVGLYLATIIGGLAFAVVYSWLFAKADSYHTTTAFLFIWRAHAYHITTAFIIYGGMALPFALLAAGAAVWAVYKSDIARSGTRIALYLLTIPGTVVVLFSLTGLLTAMGGPLVHKVIPLEQLRMVIFAITLIVVMLLKPQGLLAHHEFSWSWVKKLFGIEAAQTAVAS